MIPKPQWLRTLTTLVRIWVLFLAPHGGSQPTTWSSSSRDQVPSSVFYKNEAETCWAYKPSGTQTCSKIKISKSFKKIKISIVYHSQLHVNFAFEICHEMLLALVGYFFSEMNVIVKQRDLLYDFLVWLYQWYSASCCCHFLKCSSRRWRQKTGLVRFMVLPVEPSATELYYWPNRKCF